MLKIWQCLTSNRRKSLLCVLKGNVARAKAKLADFQGFHQIGVVSKSTRLAYFLHYIRNTLSHIKKRECSFFIQILTIKAFEQIFWKFSAQKKIIDCFYLLLGKLFAIVQKSNFGQWCEQSLNVRLHILDEKKRRPE